MFRKIRQKLLCKSMAIAVAVSFAFIPFPVTIASANDTSSVTRIGGSDRYETAALIAQKGWTGVTDNVVLSAGMTDNLVDAVTAGPLASKLKAPILLTDGGQTLNSYAKAELLRLKPKKVFITSGTGVIKPSVVEEIKAMGITTVLLGGSDRYETAVNIAKELANQGAKISQVILVTGGGQSADALSVAPIAAAQEIPILTTTQAELPASVKAYIESIKEKVTDSYVIGGPAAVSDYAQSQLPGNVKRYSGQTRYETNLEVLKNFTKLYRNKKVYVANGETLVDALAGVPLMAASQSPIVLVNQQLTDATKEYVKLNISTNDMIALGGEGVVPAAVMNTLTAKVSYATDKTTVGSTDATKILEIKDNILITGNDVTLENAKTDYSVYIKGNNATLKNLNVKGTVFIDPGTNGTATLEGVTAANIVILSGAPHSINITQTTAGQITISSDGDTSVVLTTVTTNGVTVQTAVVYENGVKVGTVTINSGAGNNLGSITIHSDPGQTIEVNLTGTFNQPIRVEGKGNSNINLGTDTTVETMFIFGNALTYVPVGSSINTLTSESGATATVWGGGKVNGTATSLTNPSPGSIPSGGGGGSTTSLVINSITSGASGPSIANINNTSKKIEIIAGADLFKQPNIKVNQNATMTLTVKRTATTYNLGSWDLTNSASGNDIFSVSNADKLDILEVLKVFQATGIGSSEIFKAIDFQALLTATKSMDEDDKKNVYKSIADIFIQSQGTSASTAFYKALNLPGIYAVADSTTQNSILDIIAAAIPGGAVTANELLGTGTSAAAIKELTDSGQINTFVNNINFTELFDVLRTSSQKDAIFSAINFTAMYNAIKTLPTENKFYIYADFASLYQAALTVDTDAIDYGLLLQLLMKDPNKVYLTLTNSKGTIEYKVSSTS